MKELIPNFAWYSAESQRLGLKFPRCPFGNVNACPRYFYSLSLLGDYGCTKIEKEEDERLTAFWKNSPLEPKTREQDTGISSVDHKVSDYNNFCPEVAFDRFGIFATYFSPHRDEIDTGFAHECLRKEGVSANDQRWFWRSIIPQHYAECPFYSQLSHDWHKLLPRSASLTGSALAGPLARFEVFISHASEDKDAFVRGLAAELARLGLRVWYDEWTLKLGDSLRQKIDEGLGSSDFGVVVLSNNFFAKDWPQAELDGLFAREMEGRKVILPVWHNVTREEVLSHSPLLAGKMAAPTNEGIEAVAKKIFAAIRRTGLTDSVPVVVPPIQVSPNPGIRIGGKFSIELGKRHRHVRENILQINPRRMADFYGFEKVVQLEACERGDDEFSTSATQKLREFFFVSQEYLEGEFQQVFDSFDVTRSADDCKKFIAKGFHPILLCLNEDRKNLWCWPVFHKEHNGYDRIVTANSHGYFASSGGGKSNVIHLIEAAHHHGLGPRDIMVQRTDRKVWDRLESWTFYQKGLGGGAGMRGPDDEGQDHLLAWWKEFEDEQARIKRPPTN